MVSFILVPQGRACAGFWVVSGSTPYRKAFFYEVEAQSFAVSSRSKTLVMRQHFEWRRTVAPRALSGVPARRMLVRPGRGWLGCAGGNESPDLLLELLDFFLLGSDQLLEVVDVVLLFLL